MSLGKQTPVDTQTVPTIALIDWSHLIEDFLDNLGVSFGSFQEEFRGSWIFGYIDALQAAGVRVVLFCVSARVAAPWRFIHVPTNAPVCVLPALAVYRAIRRRIPNPYGSSVEEAFGDIRGVCRPILATLKDITAYLATPLNSFAGELRREGCSAILCQDYEHPRFDACVLLGKLMRLPVFATFQGGDTQYTSFERPLRPLTLRACAGLIIATQSEAQRVCSRYALPPAKVKRIFNPINVEMWRAMDRRQARTALGIPADARVAVWHGRIELYRKGLDILLNAWDQVCRNRPGRDLRLLLVGTGNDAEDLRRRIADMHLEGVQWIDKFLHDCTAIRLYLSAADVYTFASRHEGFPVAPIEAMSCGLPVVAANTPGVTDIFEGGEASGGLVVPSGDGVAFSLALQRLLGNETFASELGKRARRRADARFSLGEVGEQLRSFLFKSGAAVDRPKGDRDHGR
jgi:glycosyltransferase involved in cell wall biosynthesis